jgi:hypothetical protein
MTEATEITDTTVRGESRWTLGFAHALHLGGEISSLDIAYRSSSESLASRNADGTFVAKLTPIVDLTPSGQIATVFAEDAWRPTERLMVTPGIRLTHYDATSAWYAEPRLAAVYQLSREIALKGGLGVDHQFVNRVVQEDRLHGDSAFWTLAGGGTVPVPTSRQFSVGARVERAGVTFDVEGYSRSLDDLAMYAPRTIPGDTPLGLDDALHIGSGTASGGEAALSVQVPANTTWVTYAYTRTEYSFPTLEADVFLAPQDQKHQFKVADVFRVGPGWTFGATWVYASGRPTTAVDSVGLAWLPVGAVVTLPAFAAKDSSRLPGYHRLDLSAEKAFTLGAIRPSIGVAFLNLYDRANVSYQEYQGYGSTPVTTDVSLVGRAINLFARVAF